MGYQLVIPARTNILGNPADGVVLTSMALEGLPPYPHDSILDLPKAAVNRLYTDGELSLWLLEAIGIVLTAKSCYTLACESSRRSVWSEGCSAGSRWPTNQLPGNEDQSV